MGIIPRLILMARHRQMADYLQQQENQKLAEAQAREQKREQAQMLAALNPEAFARAMQFNLGSLLRD